MTEPEWLACDDPIPMVTHLKEAMWHRTTVGARKLRLFACACCRIIWPLLTDQRSRNAVETAERFADGLAGKEELETAEEAATAVIEPFKPSTCAATAAVSDSGALAAWYAATYSSQAAVEPGAWEIWRAVKISPTAPVTPGRQGMSSSDVTIGMAMLLHDIVINPFRPVLLDPARISLTVVSLAQAVYDERILPSGEFDQQRLAVLADALDEVGAPGEYGAHLRGDAPHIRGCWVVDACLGKQ